MAIGLQVDVIYDAEHPIYPMSANLLKGQCFTFILVRTFILVYGSN